jgi:hypothetical protein
MYLAELPPAAQEAISRLNTLSAAIDEASSSVNKTEDIYRDSAIVYHCSQLAARQPANFPQTQLDQLKELFELSSVEEYDAHFGTLHGIVRSLAELRATHVRYSGSTEDLCKRVRELEAAFNILSIQLRGFTVAMDIRIDIVNALDDCSRALYETDSQGARCAWQNASGPDPVLRPEPYRKGEEWMLFRAWVGALPETQLAMQAGRTLDEAALDLLYGEEEAFEEETES